MNKQTLSLAGVLGLSICLGSIILSGAGSEARAAAPASRQRCVTKHFETKLLKKLCKKGGQREVKIWMKAFVKRVKAGGDTASCKGCHSDVKKTFHLKPSGQKDFASLLKKYPR